MTSTEKFPQNLVLNLCVCGSFHPNPGGCPNEDDFFMNTFSYFGILYFALTCFIRT